MSILGIIIVVLLAVALGVIVIYNTLVRARLRTEGAWADIDVQLKRRYDLIPNLVEAVRGYAEHEQTTLDAVIDARSKASSMQIDIANTNAEDLAVYAGMQSGLSGALGKLFALAENYPDLKANQNFLQLQEELSDTEDKIQAARRFFNSAVRDYNVLLETVPSNIIANMFHFTARTFFDATDAERTVPEVRFNA